jgi:MFS family permease
MIAADGDRHRLAAAGLAIVVWSAGESAVALTIASVAAPAKPVADRNPFAGVQYRWWWAMSFCASVAVGLQLVTVPTYVLDRTDTRFYIALALLCQTVPTALLTLLGGASADRFGRRRILLTTFAIAASTSTVYVLLASADARALWPVFLIAAVVGATTAFGAPARSALLNRLAPGSRLQNGVILGTFAFMGGQWFVGPALGGLTVSALGLTAGFGLEVTLLALAWLCAWRLRGVDAEAAPTQGSLVAQIGEGLRYVRLDPRIWQIMLVSALPALCFMGVAQATFPVLARDTFARGAGGIGALNAGMGLGVLAGSLLLLRWGPRQNRGRFLILAVPASGAVFVLVGFSPTLALAAALLVLFGLGAAVGMNYATTLLQTYTDQRLIGRVMSVWSLCFMAAVPLGNLHAGIGIQLGDPRVVLVYSGAASVAFGVLAFARLRVVRMMD